MRGTSLSVIAAVWIVAAVGGQPPGKKEVPPSDAKPAQSGANVPNELEKLIALALAHSPDVQLADAKRREAEAELHRARFNVMQRVIDLVSTIEMQKSQLAFAEANLMQAEKRDFRQAITKVAEAKATLTRSEKQLELLIGSGPAQPLQPGDAAIIALPGVPGAAGANGGGAGIGLPDAPRRRPPSPAMADKIRKALDTPIKSANFEGIELNQALNYYRGLASVPIVIALGDRGGETITLKLDKELPLGSHLQAVQDLAPGLYITVRDYGILVTFDVLPDDGMPFLDFWQGKPH